MSDISGYYAKTPVEVHLLLEMQTLNYFFSDFFLCIIQLMSDIFGWYTETPVSDCYRGDISTVSVTMSIISIRFQDSEEKNI